MIIDKIGIKNFKSIAKVDIALGRVNVFIGANGCGKSNLLEALAFISAAKISSNIDNDILGGKGVRVAKPRLTISSFRSEKQQKNIEIYLNVGGTKHSYDISTGDMDNIDSKWKCREVINEVSTTPNVHKPIALAEPDDITHNPNDINVALTKPEDLDTFLSDYLIYCLHTPALRGLTNQSLKGIHGENLDVMIANFDPEEQKMLQNYNYLIEWLDNFFIDANNVLRLKGYKLNLSKSQLYFNDKYMMRKNNVFSSENANEGILHVLFYLATAISKKTPKLFAIDNIESCLNPHLCTELMRELIKLAKISDKQLLITTHHPAILDALNLNDSEVRLFEVVRNDKGHTLVKRIEQKPTIDTHKYKLSELWMRGMLGATPKNF